MIIHLSELYMQYAKGVPKPEELERRLITTVLTLVFVYPIDQPNCLWTIWPELECQNGRDTSATAPMSAAEIGTDKRISDK